MNRLDRKPFEMIVGRPVVVVIDIQKGSYLDIPAGSRLEFMPDRIERLHRTRGIVDAAREAKVPLVFIKEVHRADRIDFGRELDGMEGVHCIEDDPRSEFAFEEMGMLPGDYKVPKRRYSAFYGTDLEILLKGLKANTLLLVGGFTDVCVHYTFVDGHQGDYVCRVAGDCVHGSSVAAHDAALRAMEYLQTGAIQPACAMIDAIRAYGERQARA